MHAPDLKTNKNIILEKKRVLTNAVLRLSDQLELSRQELAAIIGRSEATLSRTFTKKNYFIDPESKEGQLSILLIRLYRSLDILFGGNTEQCKIWLRSNNTYLQNKPILLIQSIEGLIITIQYLDAMRGKN